MALDTASSLITAIGEYHLLEADQWQELQALQRHSGDARELARELVNPGG